MYNGFFTEMCGRPSRNFIICKHVPEGFSFPTKKAPKGFSRLSVLFHTFFFLSSPVPGVGEDCCCGKSDEL